MAKPQDYPNSEVQGFKQEKGEDFITYKTLEYLNDMWTYDYGLTAPLSTAPFSLLHVKSLGAGECKPDACSHHAMDSTLGKTNQANTSSVPFTGCFG